MKQLLSFAVLGCMVAGSGLAIQKERQECKVGQECTVDILWDFLKSPVKGCSCPSKQAIERNNLAKMMFSYCAIGTDPLPDKFSEILCASRTQCGEYTFVDYGKASAQTVCAMIGMVPASEKRFPDELRKCAKHCRYSHDKMCVTESSVQSDWDHYQTYPSCDGESESSSSEVGNGKCPSSCEWRHRKECAVLCKPYRCANCQSPTLLTFEDGEDKGCDLFVEPGCPGVNSVYRGFNIKNGGVYNPWKARCDFANDCTYQWDINATVTKQQGLFMSQPEQAMSISRKNPFGLVQLFLTHSSIKEGVKRQPLLKITARQNKKDICSETVALTVGCPTLWIPINSKAFSKVTKITFQFVVFEDDTLENHYLDIDNMLVCM